MSLEQQKRKMEEYKKSLEAAIHYYDPKIQEVKNGLNELLFQKENGLSDETLEEIKELGWKGSPESCLDYMIELGESGIFYASTFLPLLGIINVFKNKGKWTFSDAKTVVEYNQDKQVYSAREIYRIMIQLPEYLVLNKLKDVCIKNDTDLILDAFERRDEEAFIKAFELLHDKQSIKDYFLFIAKSMDVCNSYGDFGAKVDSSIEEFKDDAEAVIQIRDEMRQYASTPSIIDATDGMSVLMQIPPAPNDMKTAIKLYKTALSIYLVFAPHFDAVTNEYADRVIQNPKYIDITNNLLAECKDIIKKAQKENADGNNDTNGDLPKRQTRNVPFPLPFPERLGIINKEEQDVFFNTLYNELVKRRFISNETSLADFQYLLGGEKPEDYDGAKIVWLYTKTQLHCFFICYYGDSAGKEYGWKVLNKMFIIEGDSHLENNPSDVKSASSKSYISTFNSIIERAKKGQVLDFL